MSTPSSDLNTAYTKLATLPNNLLATTPGEMDKYKMIWAPPAWIGGERKEKNKGLWSDGNRTSPIFPLWGVIDGRKSKLGDYGNCWYDEETGTPPNRAALSKSKFSVCITYPKLPRNHPDEPYALSVSNQIYCLDAIQDNATAALTASGEVEASTTDWARFEQSDDGTIGWLHATIGSVYESKTKKIKGRMVTNRNLVQASQEEVVEKPDIVDDTLGFLGRLNQHNLKHNELLPCFLPNGERIGRCSSELRRELYDGRWIRMDVELVMWNMKADGKRIFQLQVVRLEVLNVPAASMDGIAFASLDPSDYKIKKPQAVAQPSDHKAKKVEPVGGPTSSSPTKAIETSTDSSKTSADEEDTVSESEHKAGSKRVTRAQGGGPAKK
ncbi:hypothetical protein AURDEDRAFT_170878 [Auricularia subglabra TFB-10046 SS5]|nr:hypothetical protein AURDEDRAFT_170878 [Auricularia subglabra TFB-10046 SS5]